MSTIRRRFAVLVLGLPVLAGAVALRSSSHESTGLSVADAPVRLAIKVPRDVAAGASFALEVPNFSGPPLVVDVLSALTSERLETRFVRQSSKYEVTIPSRLTQSAGVLGLVVTTKGSPRAMGSAEVRIRPGPAASGIVPLAAPRSMVADKKHWTMVSVIPTDDDGNGLEDGTPVMLHVLRPNGSEEVLEGTLRNLIAGIRVNSGLLAGRTRIRVDVGGVSGAEVEVVEVPAGAAPFTLNGPAAVTADGRSLAAITTSTLTDVQGNQLLDGTGVTLQGLSPAGAFRSVAQTVHGVATFTVEAPPEPGQLTMTGYVGAVASTPLTVIAESNDVRFNVAIRPVLVAGSSIEQPSGRVNVRVGPVLTKLGGFVTDGTAVVASFPDGSRRVTQVVKGIASFEFSPGRQREMRIRILGAQRTVALP